MHAGLSRGPYVRVLRPVEVAAVASDLESLLRDEAVHTGPCLFPSTTHAVLSRIQAALAFTRELEKSGAGLVYVIGRPGSLDEVGPCPAEGA